MEKIRMIAAILLVCGFVVFNLNSKIIVNKRDIVNFEIIEVVGIDIKKGEGENVEISFVKNDTTSSSEETEDSESEEKVSSVIVSITGTSFNDALRKAQVVMNKYVTNWYVKYFIIGEETAKNNMIDAMDFVIRDIDTKFNAKIYISKGQTAKEFLNNIETNGDKISSKIQNMEQSSNKISNSYEMEITDFFKMISEEVPSGLIPTLENYDVTVGEKEIKDIGFGGFAIFNKDKITQILDLKSSRAANFILNRAKFTNIDILKSNGTLVSLGIIKIKPDISFEFNENKLEKIKILFVVDSNIEEVYAKEDIYNEKTIKELENMQSDIIKKEAEEVLRKAQKEKIDFLNIKNKLIIKHPYKWEHLKDSWEETFENAEIEMYVDSSIRRTYDVISEINY